MMLLRLVWVPDFKNHYTGRMVNDESLIIHNLSGEIIVPVIIILYYKRLNMDISD